MNFPLVLRAPAVSMPSVLLENVLKITDEQFKQERTVKCGFERLINLPYSFYEDLLQQENLKNKAFSQPIMIIHGDCDDIVPLKDVGDFAEGKDISLQIISGADHRFRNDGEIEKVITLTKQFLGLVCM